MRFILIVKKIINYSSILLIHVHVVFPLYEYHLEAPDCKWESLDVPWIPKQTMSTDRHNHLRNHATICEMQRSHIHHYDLFFLHSYSQHKSPKYGWWEPNTKAGIVIVETQCCWMEWWSLKRKCGRMWNIRTCITRFSQPCYERECFDRL